MAQVTVIAVNFDATGIIMRGLVDGVDTIAKVPPNTSSAAALQALVTQKTNNDTLKNSAAGLSTLVGTTNTV
jgi:hypothetical protein